MSEKTKKNQELPKTEELKPKVVKQRRKPAPKKTIDLGLNELGELRRIVEAVEDNPTAEKKGRKRTKRKTLDISLSELRKLTGKTQEEVADATQWSQNQLSKIERRDDHMLSTLRRYIEALGGRLIVMAEFGETRIKLHGV